MNIELELSKQLFEPVLYPYLLDYSKRWEVYKGSAGSGKSYFITQKLIVRAINEQIRILVCRRYGTTIRQTCFALFKSILDKWKLTPYVKIRETDFNIRFPNGSEIIFLGLDEETKLLSLSNISCIFVEEAFEVPQDIIEQLNLRMRGTNTNQQIILAFNPISKNHWLYNFCEVNPPQSFFYSQTTYKDNPFLSSEYINAIEELYTRNPRKASVYADGNWGVDTEGLVFQNWRIEEFNPMELASKGLEHRAGSDIGFIDKTSVIDTLFDRDNRKIYVFNEFYKSGCQLDEVYNAIIEMNLQRVKIYFDSAEPRTIQYFRNKGLNAVPCVKGAGTVKARIAFLQNNEIIVLPKCKNLITELENFSYIKSKQTGEFTEETTHEFSHAIDGLGYAYSDIYTSGRLKTFDKSILGL